MLLMGESSVFEWLCCVCSQTRLGPGPSQRGRQVQRCGKRTAGPPKAGGSEYLELHGVFSITLRALGAGLLSKVWFPCFALSAGRRFGFGSSRTRSACRGGAGRRRSIVGCRRGRDFLPLVRGFRNRIYYLDESAPTTCLPFHLTPILSVIREVKMYFCNSRCLCLWSVMLVTKPNLPTDDREQRMVLILPDGKKRSFDKLIKLAQWSAANTIGTSESKWLNNGREVL